MRRAPLAVMAAMVVAGSAEARFGKRSEPSSSSTSPSDSSSEPSQTRPRGGALQSATSASHQAVAVDSPPVSTRSSGHFRPWFGPRPWRWGFYSGAYVPRYGYGYACAAPVVAVEEPADQVEEAPQLEPSAIRVEVGVEAVPYLNGEVGVTLGLLARVEGQQWGASLGAQNFAVKADDGSGGVDHLQELTGHLTYTFLSGKHGRLRGEVGAHAMFAPDAVMAGPAFGLSGSLWVGGPLAIEGAAHVTPVPYQELDYRAGVALGFGSIGVRAGWRTQVLDDNGVVGDPHRDVFMGPYFGLSVAL